MINIEKKFEENGYVILPANKKLLDKLRSNILMKIKKNKNIKITNQKKIDNSKILNNFHHLINSKNLNSLRFDIYNKINSNPEFSNIFYDITKIYLDSLIGNEISMQKKINLSIQTTT